MQGGDSPASAGYSGGSACGSALLCKNTIIKVQSAAKTVATHSIFFLATLLGSLLLDRAVRPRQGHVRRWEGQLVQMLVTSALFGLFLAASGGFLVAAALTTALVALLTAVSNAKYAMLGEPLLFSDLALLAAVFRHPRFYLTAISARERAILAVGAPVLVLAFALLFVRDLAPHLAGAALTVTAAASLVALLTGRSFRQLARSPDIDADLPRYGLTATLLLYWMRWRATPNPPPCRVSEAREIGGEAPPELVVIVQCESFADPVELTGEERRALPALRRAQTSAWQWGDLSVSGFGAYTMRTEYGLLFGRSEAELGFRRYDPFLTAHGETSYALSARLSSQGYQCLFVHPHDMRFYGRDRLMPAIGFNRLIGEENFAPVTEGARYVDDGALGASLGDLIDEAAGPTLIYAVTMENHGPWDMDKSAGAQSRLDAYLRHLRSSDAMLAALIERLSGAGRPALLVFFGDHRPSIPGVTQPGGDRHTPYAMLRFAGDGQIVSGGNRRVDLSPDELHHAILDRVRSADRSDAAAPAIDAQLSAMAVRG